jgi:hypothetical protein
MYCWVREADHVERNISKYASVQGHSTRLTVLRSANGELATCTESLVRVKQRASAPPLEACAQGVGSNE